MSDASHAWINAERRCYQYLLKVLESIAGKDGYLAELPDELPSKDKKVRLWFFSSVPGAEVLRIKPENRPGKAWRVKARWEGIFNDRDEAMLACGLLRNALPAGAVKDTALEGVTDFSMISEFDGPIRGVAIIAAENSEDGSAEARVWVVGCDLEMVFANTPKWEG